MDEQQYTEKQIWALKEASRLLSEYYCNSIIVVKGSRMPVEVLSNADLDLLQPMLDQAYYSLFPSDKDKEWEWDSFDDD